VKKRDKKDKNENIKKANTIREKPVKEKEQKETSENEAVSFKYELFSEVIVKNPVLVSTIGLCPVVAICTSLKSAVVLSIITYFTMIFSQIISASVLKHCPQWARVALYALSGMAIVAPSMLLLENVLPENMIALGIYLPLLAVNPLITRQCERVAVKSTVKQAFVNAVSCSTGYAAVLIITGFVRELLGSGTLWDYRVFSFPTATALTNPFGGFIVIGFMAAILRWYFKKIDPEYAEDLAVNSRSSIKKPKVKKSQKHKKAHVSSMTYEPQEYLPHQEEVTTQESVQEEIPAEESHQEDEQNLTETFEQALAENTTHIDNSEEQILEIQLEPQIKEIVQEETKANKKIEYTSKELEDLMSKSLEDIIKDTIKETPQEPDADKEVPKQ